MAEEIWILKDEPIRVSFDTKGYVFYKGGRGVLGRPVEADLRLIAVKAAEKIEIKSVSHLEGRVVIRSSKEALEFVRLFTSIKTHYLFPDIQYIEPGVAEDVPGPGEYASEYKERMNLELARSRREASDFVIERNLVDRGGKLFRATERVGMDGAYALMETVVIDENSPITYPMYE